MSGEQLRSSREQLGWTQAQAARHAGVSQPYWCLMEKNRRPVPERVARTLARYSQVSPTVLPVTCSESVKAPGALAAALGALGYPGFAYLRKKARPVNPACLVLEALKQRPLEPRLAAALPWVLLAYRDLDWDWLLDEAKRHNLQNRLGFLVTLARRAAELRGANTTAHSLSRWAGALDDARLVKEDAFGRLTEAERRYLKDERSEEARYWNMLTSLRPEHLQYATQAHA